MSFVFRSKGIFSYLEQKKTATPQNSGLIMFLSY